MGLSNIVDSTGTSVGKRYARTDEIGVPFAVTVRHGAEGLGSQGAGQVPGISREDGQDRCVLAVTVRHWGVQGTEEGSTRGRGRGEGAGQVPGIGARAAGRGSNGWTRRKQALAMCKRKWWLLQ